MGRIVPWVCWQEWHQVRDWLLSQSRDDVACGIRRVEVWRARGRVPLGVDITASLLETALCDPSFWARPAAASSAAVPGRAAAADTWLTTSSGVSQQQLRLQYAATIVRMVNGITDSQQKGRVALSVNSLAESAGLSRLLVDVRHEATHNELPSLSTLQLAAQQALDWLLLQYWQRQADHVAACHTRIQEILTAVLMSCEAAAAAGRRSTAAAAAAAADSDADEDADKDDGTADASGYKAADGRKQRKSRMAELKGLLSPSHTPLLVDLLLERHTLFPAQPPASQDPTAAGAAAAAAVSGAQQHQQDPAGAGVSAAAQQAAFACLQKQYSQLAPQLLEEVISRLCCLAIDSGPAAQQQQQQQQEEEEEQEVQGILSDQRGMGQAPAVSSAACFKDAEQLLCWLHLLLPPAAAIASSSSTVKAAASPAGSSKGGKRGPSAKRSFGLTPAADVHHQQQQQQQPQQPQATTALQAQLLKEFEPELLKRLLSNLLLAQRSSAAGAQNPAAAAAALGSAAHDTAMPAAAAAAAVAPGCLSKHITVCLQQAQLLLLSALAASGKKASSSVGTGLVVELCEMAVPPALPLQQQQQQQTARGHDWLQQQKDYLDAACKEQEQQLPNWLQRCRKRPRSLLVTEDAPRAAAAAAAAVAAAVGASDVSCGAVAAAAAQGGDSSRRRWRRADSWRPSAVGCLPGPRRPSLLLAELQAEVDFDAAPGRLGVVGTHSNAATAGASPAVAGAGPTSDAAGRDAGDGVDLEYAAVMNVEVAAGMDEDRCEAAGAAVGDAAAAAVGGGGDDCQQSRAEPQEVKLGRWWQMNRQELPQLQQAVHLLL